MPSPKDISRMAPQPARPQATQPQAVRPLAGPLDFPNLDRSGFPVDQNVRQTPNESAVRGPVPVTVTDGRMTVSAGAVKLISGVNAARIVILIQPDTNHTIWVGENVQDAATGFRVLGDGNYSLTHGKSISVFSATGGDIYVHEESRAGC